MSDQLSSIKEKLAALVACPSVSAVDADFDMSNAAVVEMLAGWFDEVGFATTTQTVSTQPLKQNLIAHIGPALAPQQGLQPRGLVLSGHTDTVPYDAGHWDSDPFVLTEDNGCWYGLGSADMKCFFPIILAALEGLDPATFKYPLQILATADEESSMAGASAIETDGPTLGRYVLIGEPTELTPIFKHKGILIGRVEFVGRSGHSSKPAAGRNALDAMHAMIAWLIVWRDQLALEFTDPQFEVAVPTLNLGRISGGDSPNRICAQCELLFDIRIMPGMDPNALETELHAMVAEVASAHDLAGEFAMPMPPLSPMDTPHDSLLLTELEKLSGKRAETVAFATEGPFFNAVGCESVIFGPGNIATAHQPNEYVEIERVRRMVEIVRRLIRQVCCDE